MGYKTPKEALELVQQVGNARAHQTIDQTFVLSFMAGLYVALGAYLALIVVRINHTCIAYCGVKLHAHDNQKTNWTNFHCCLLI